jgi:hypothetical protein
MLSIWLHYAHIVPQCHSLFQTRTCHIQPSFVIRKHTQTEEVQTRKKLKLQTLENRLTQEKHLRESNFFSARV